MPDYYKDALDYRVEHAGEFSQDSIAAMESARLHAKETYGDCDTKFLHWLKHILSRADDFNDKVRDRKEGTFG